MTIADAPPQKSLGPAAVPLKDIERELSRQMGLLRDDKQAPVQRVRMSNLIVYCMDAVRAAEVREQLHDVVLVHPARVLLLIGNPSGPDQPITAEVEVCAHQMGSRQQACSELVTLQAGGTSVPRLAFAVRALLVGDLPVNLWWACNEPPPFAGPLLLDLSDEVQQIVYDSLGWIDPARGVAATADWLQQIECCTGDGRWRVSSDLNWRRLKYWRRLAAQALDPKTAPGAAESVTELTVDHGPHAVIQAWLLAAWMVRRLGWQVQVGKVEPGREILWNVKTPQGKARLRIRRAESGTPEVHGLRLACQLDGEEGALQLHFKDEARLMIHHEGPSHCNFTTMTIPPKTPAEIVGRQLSDRERDPVFRDAMEVARQLAQSLIG